MPMVRFLQEQEEYNRIKHGLVEKKVWPEQRFSPYLTPLEVNRLCHELIIWAQTTKACRYTTLLVDFDIAPGTWDRWLKQYPELDEAYDQVKLFFAEKRESAAHKGEMNSGIVMATLPTHCREYRAWRKEQNAAKAAAQGKGEAVINIVGLEKMPETDVVPQKVYGGTAGDDD
jgi:hypothetical protein